MKKLIIGILLGALATTLLLRLAGMVQTVPSPTTQPAVYKAVYLPSPAVKAEPVKESNRWGKNRKQPTAEQHAAIEKQKEVFGEILRLMVTEGLDSAADITTLAREMFSLEPQNGGRDRFSRYLSPQEAQQATESRHRDNGLACAVHGLPDSQLAAVVKITAFNDSTAQTLETTLDTLQAQNIRRVVLDLRGNRGGILASALESLALFVNTDIYYREEEEPIILTEKQRKLEVIYTRSSFLRQYNRSAGKFRYLSAVLLINHRTTSAAEIFAGCMQQFGHTLIGEKTFGKGVGQSVFTLPDSSELWLTVSEFFFGNECRPLQNQGVKPWIEVAADSTGTDDPQLKEALSFFTELKLIKVADE